MDVGRTITGGSAGVEPEGPGPDSTQIIQRAVVIDTLDNLSLRDDEALEDLGEIVSNPQDLDQAPRNSIVAKLCGLGKGRSEEKNIICYPFFSSHISLPVKAGEQVWIIFETPTNPETRGFWMSRIHEPLLAEDPNYTHGDRRSDPYTKEQGEEEDKDGEPMEQKIPSFHNGPDRFEEDDDVLTLNPVDRFEMIFTGSAGVNDFVIEPVPRFTKRPGDLVFQGSHNATIILGTDRGYKEGDAIDNAKSNAHMEEPLIEGLGAIDIVVGRGRINVSPKVLSGEDDPNEGVSPERTEPQIAMNSRKSFESNKNPNMLDDSKLNTRTNACEGDPDFVNDAARIYLTMKSSPDEEFSLIPDKIPTAFDAVPEEAKDVSAAIVKADEVRIVARKIGKDSPTEASQPSGDNKLASDFQGSIRLIKEGKKDDDAAAIYLLPDGTIQISGKVIYLGRAGDDGGSDGLTAGEGEGESEPYLRYSDFEIWADGLIDAINTAFEDAVAEINVNGTALNSMATVGAGTASGGFAPPWSPNSALGAATQAGFAEGMAPSAMTYSHSGDKSAIEEFKSKKDAMKAIRSSRIFGE